MRCISKADTTMCQNRRRLLLNRRRLLNRSKEYGEALRTENNRMDDAGALMIAMSGIVIAKDYNSCDRQGLQFLSIQEEEWTLHHSQAWKLVWALQRGCLKRVSSERGHHRRRLRCCLPRPLLLSPEQPPAPDPRSPLLPTQRGVPLHLAGADEGSSLDKDGQSKRYSFDLVCTSPAVCPVGGTSRCCHDRLLILTFRDIENERKRSLVASELRLVGTVREGRAAAV
jgi:hypothetical protein